jgi:PKD repeat protein
MKKHLFFLFMWFATLPAIAQMTLTVYGTITDLNGGSPVVNHAVNIFADSSNGFIYFNTVYTNSNGFYADTILVPPAILTGTIIITTYDCNNLPLSGSFTFGSGTSGFQQNFQICTTPSNCYANFSYQYISPLTVQFFDLSIGGNGSWYWEFGDGTFTQAQNPVHTYSIAGLYEVTLTIGDPAAPCYDSMTQYIRVGDTINSGCVADFYSVPDSTNPQNILFFNTSISNGNVLTYSWNFGDPLSGSNNTSNLENPSHLFSALGTYDVCLTIQGTDSLCYDMTCETITIGNTGGCQAQYTYYPDSTPAGGANGIQFIDLSSGNISSWYWDFGDGTYSTEQNPFHIYQQYGTYYVCLTIQAPMNGVMCTSTWCMNVTVGNAIGCVSYFTFTQNLLDVTFTGHMVNGQAAIYSWDFGDGLLGQGEQVTHSYAAAGIYFVTLATVTTDSTGCLYSSGQSIAVGDSTQFNQIYGQVFAGNFPVTAGFVMIFSLDTNINYLPYFDIDIIDSSGVYIFPYVPQGNFLVYAIPLDATGYLPTYYGDVLNWEDATIISLGDPNNPYDIHLIPAINFPSGSGGINGQINTGGLKAGMTDRIMMMVMDESGNTLSFDRVSDEGTFGFASMAYGTYYLHAELAGVTSDLIRIDLTESNPIVNVILTFNGNKILGTHEGKELVDAWIVYPNPFRDQININITIKEDTEINIEVFTLTGQVVASTLTKAITGGNNLILPTSSLPAGIYTIRIFSPAGIHLTKKLVKTR